MSKEFTIEDAKAENIYVSLKGSRNEPTISLENIAEICGQVFDGAELEVFIRDLENLKSKG